MIVTKIRRPCRGSTAHCRPWTEEEEQVVRSDYKELGADHVAGKIGRSREAVRSRAWKLDLFRRPRRWTPEEDRRLRNALDETGLGWAATRLGRTPRALYDRALRLGIPVGRPPGYESIAAASKRTGFDFKSIRKILIWAGVKIRHSLSQPNGNRQRTRLQRMVEQIDVDDAVAAWVLTETPYAAARRLHCDDGTIVEALLDSGLQLPPRPAGGKHWRVPSVLIEQALAMRRAKKNPDLGSTAQGAAGVFPGANARRDAAARSISGRRTPSGMDRRRGGIPRDTTVTLPKLPTKKNGRIKAEGVTRPGEQRPFLGAVL